MGESTITMMMSFQAAPFATGRWRLRWMMSSSSHSSSCVRPMLKAGALTQIRNRAAIGECVFAQRLQTLATRFARFVNAVAMGAFDYQHIGRAGRPRPGCK